MSYKEIADELRKGETVKAIVFGPWGWGSPPVPLDKRGVVLTLEEAKPFLEGWSFSGGYGSPTCYATYIWTNRRVLWVTQYDGSTTLSSVPRHPMEAVPNMPGG